jgi:hypothetical protein
MVFVSDVWALRGRVGRSAWWSDEFRACSSQEKKEKSESAWLEAARKSAATTFPVARHSRETSKTSIETPTRNEGPPMQTIAIRSELTELELDLVTGGEEKKAPPPAKKAEEKKDDNKGKTETETKLAASLKLAAEAKSGGERSASATFEVSAEKTWTSK